MTVAFDRDGYVVLPHDPTVLAWAKAAHDVAKGVVKTPGDMRHGGTWRVGVDELPNAPDGSIKGIALKGAWSSYVTVPEVWHCAQLSVVYPGYPQQDQTDSDAAHGFRIRRDAAHVDGLLPEGPRKRRHLREPHSFVLGLPLNDATASPLVVWQGSHKIIQAAFVTAFGGIDPSDWGDVDVTDIYQAVRREVFETCPRIELPALPGEATLLHRHLVHGVAPWRTGDAPEEGRMIAYLRPQVVDVVDWI